MIEYRVWHARDGWRVEVRDGPRWMQFGAYAQEPDAQAVAARIVAALYAERRHRQPALFPESA